MQIKKKWNRLSFEAKLAVIVVASAYIMCVYALILKFKGLI